MTEWVLAQGAVEDWGPAGLFTLLVGLVGLFIRVMLQDRGAGFTLAGEREKDIVALRDQNELLRREISEQRTLKHAAINDLAVAKGTLDVVRRLAPNCTCHALDAIADILQREES